MTVSLRLPSVLRVAVGADHIKTSGATVGEAIDRACEIQPRLAHHILQPNGELRGHVLCLLNGRSLPRDSFRSHALQDGDELLIHQAISGG